MTENNICCRKKVYKTVIFLKTIYPQLENFKLEKFEFLMQQLIAILMYNADKMVLVS